MTKQKSTSIVLAAVFLVLSIGTTGDVADAPAFEIKFIIQPLK